MDDVTIAYLAGFFDGEGCIQINKNSSLKWGKSPRYYLMVSATQVNPEPIKLLQEMFGGSITTRLNISNHRDIGCWRLQGKGGATFLRAILPYIIVKKSEAILALQFQNLFVSVRRQQLTIEELTEREKFKQAMHKLKKVAYNWDV